MKMQSCFPFETYSIDISRRSKALSSVQTDLPEGMSGVYQISRFVQLDAQTAGFFINVRQDKNKACDLEIGCDFCFTRDPELRKFEGFQALTRAEIAEPFENKQKYLMVSYPVFAAFVPLGALLEDGTPHPHAGTGFAFGARLGRPCDEKGSCQGYTNPLLEDCYDEVEILQLAWNGEKLTVTDRERLAYPSKVDTFKHTIPLLPPLAGVVADWEDLLTGATKVIGEEPLGRAGVCRWKRNNGHWEIAEFTPIGAPGSFEPSLIRDINGSLLYTHRTAVPEWTFALKLSPEGMEDAKYNRDIRVWRSCDNGKSWTKCVHQKDCCNGCPVSITMTKAGVPVIFTNEHSDTLGTGNPLFHGVVREKMILRVLNKERNGLLPKQLVRDAVAEFGNAPYGKGWFMDHPIGLLVRLSDHQWHSVLTMRVMDISESGGGNAATPYTGLYVEEIISETADFKPPWNFSH